MGWLVTQICPWHPSTTRRHDKFVTNFACEKKKRRSNLIFWSFNKCSPRRYSNQMFCVNISASTLTSHLFDVSSNFKQVSEVTQWKFSSNFLKCFEHFQGYCKGGEKDAVWIICGSEMNMVNLSIMWGNLKLEFLIK